jgi:hypothetical protein
MTRNSRSQFHVRPEPLTGAFLSLFLAGTCLRGTGFYSVAARTDPGMWTSILRGTANAPEQYRIGVVLLADQMARHLPHVTLARAFGILDLITSLGAVFLLYVLLLRSDTYRFASEASRWFGSAAFASLVLYLVDWSNWFQKVSTLPSAFLVAALLWLWTPSNRNVREPGLLRAACILIVVLMLSFVRADLALVVSLGFLAASLLSRVSATALSRPIAISTSLLGALLAAGVQFYLTKLRYPSATYAGLRVFMLPYDWQKPLMWLMALIFISPLLWTAAETIRQRTFARGSNGAVMLGALGYAALWFAMGRLDEVRIFLPMALATVPLTVETLMQRITTESNSPSGS